MDLEDEQILHELNKNAKINTHKLSQVLGIPISTIYAKIKRMEKEGIIKSYSVNIDWKRLGFDVRAVLEIYIDSGRMAEKKISIHDIIEGIQKISGIERVISVSGKPDIIVLMRAKSNEDLGKILMEQINIVPGISETRTLICLE